MEVQADAAQAVGRPFTTSAPSLPGRTHLIVIALVTVGIALFGWLQNRGGLVGGPISVAKMLWLNFTLLTFLVVPGCLWRNRGLSSPIRTIFSAVFFSFAVRGLIELYILYFTRSWQCIYGISHDLFTFALVVWLLQRLPQQRTSMDQRALSFAFILLPTLLVECFMAWQFSKLASPGDGIYFASEDAHFRFVNRASWAAVAAGLPILGGFLWKTRNDFGK